jgi:hypothetical protein
MNPADSTGPREGRVSPIYELRGHRWRAARVRWHRVVGAGQDLAGAFDRGRPAERRVVVWMTYASPTSSGPLAERIGARLVLLQKSFHLPGHTRRSDEFAKVTTTEVDGGDIREPHSFHSSGRWGSTARQ